MDYVKLLHYLPGMAFKMRCQVDQRPVVEYCSPGALTLYGLTAEQILSNPTEFFDLFSSSQLLSLSESLAFCANELLEWQLVLEVSVAGKKRVQQFYAAPEKQADGSTYWYGIVTDITEQFVQQDHRVRHERLLSTLFDLSPLGIALVDIETGRFLKTNAALQRMFGYTEHELSDIGPAELIEPQYLDDFQRQMLILQYQSRFEPHEAEYLPQYGNPIDVLVNGMLLDIEGEQASFWMLIENISERKASERQLLAEKERAEVAARAKSNFLASMSHEIRTPLNGVIGMLDVLKTSALSTEQQRQINIAQSSGDTLLHLLNDILDFSKMDAGKLELEQSNVNLEQLIQDITKPFEFLASQKQLQFSQHFMTDSVRWVKTDVMRLKQIINNLLSNAVKFTEQGQISLSASLRQQQSGLMLTIEVADTGIGVSAQQATLIFEPFTQADATTTRKYEGTGLGLAMCHQLCQLMGGGIHLQSQPGQGACFTIWLNVDEGEAEQTLVRPDADHIAWPKDSHILLVDDNSINCDVVRLMLHNFGLATTIAHNGQQALQVLINTPQKPVNLILMDCMMPVLDGYQATAAIRQGQAGAFYRDVPIVALTANALLGDKEKCLTAGMNGYLSKPVTQASLAKEMARVLLVPCTVATLDDTAVVVEELPTVTDARAMHSVTDELLWDRTSFLRSLGAMAGMHMQLVQSFINTLVKHQAEFIVAVRDGDAKVVQTISHSLKGSAGQMHCKPLAESAAELNKCAKLNDVIAMQAEQPRFEKMLLDTLQLLERTLTKFESDGDTDDRT